jgi:hypothetical protein
VLVLSLLAMLFTAGGVSAAPTAAPLAQGEAPAFRLELPRIVVTVDKDGLPSALGLSVADIQNMTGMDMSMARVPANTMQLMAQAGVQHVEVVINSQGLFLFANSAPLPYVAWNQESLNSLVGALQAFQVPNAPLIGRLVPFLQYLSISLAVQFPLPEGASAIKMRDPKNLLLVDAKAAQGEVPAEPSAKIYAQVDVDAEGVPSLLGISARQLQQDTGIDLSAAQVSPALMAQLAAGGVQHVQLQTKPEGLYLYLNGKPLPYLAWDKAHLATLADLLPKMMADQPWAPVAGQAVPGLQAADVRATARFPLPSGAQELPLHDFSAAQ